MPTWIPEPNLTRLFVYGTLRTGEPNHRLLEGAEHVGPARTEARFRMVDLGAYPAIVADGATSIEGELYDVDDSLLAQLDRFEGHPRFYARSAVAIEGGADAQAYLLRAAQVVGRPLIPSGSWRDRASGRSTRRSRPPRGRAG